MLHKLVSHAGFLYHQRVRGFDISESPEMDEEGKDYFLERLQKCSSYLEYGCGGSTIAAARYDKRYTSVESDPYYLHAVRSKIISLGYTPGTMLYANIGLTGPWGYPVLKAPTPGRLQRWRRYAELPWTLDIHPDLILIDGRFRVFCALTCISRQTEFEMLVDDYEGREYYRTIEAFSCLVGMRGRLAVFQPKRFDRTQLLSAIKEAASDYR